MINLLEFNKTQKRLVQSYVMHIAIRIPTIFDFGFVMNRPGRKLTHKPAARKTAGKAKALPAKKAKPYFLLGDGAFGGLALHGLMVLRGRQNLFEEIQATNLHSSDVFLPERLSALAKLFKTRRFRSKGQLDKSELNSNA
jgi:hypothetical protein